MNTVVGIDPSFTGSAVCCIKPVLGRQAWNVEEFKSAPAKTLDGRIRRYRLLVQQIVSAIPRPCDMICLEGYSFASKGSSGLSLAEFGGLLRAALLAECRWVIEVPPSTLKKFTTGAGNADKLAMAVAIHKRWGVEFKTDNQYDAFALAKLAQVIVCDEEPANEHQRAVAAKLRDVLAQQAGAA